MSERDPRPFSTTHGELEPENVASDACAVENGRRRGTLAHQINVRVAVTVATMAVMLSVLVLVMAQNLLINQLDNEIDAIPLRLQSGGPNPHGPGIPAGTILVGEIQGSRFASIVGRGDVEQFEDGVGELLALPAGRETTTLPELGRYRVSVERGPDSTVVVGLPMHSVRETMVLLTGFAGVLTLVAVGVTVLITRRLIHGATRPLEALTDTAAAVSALPLERGTVQVPRVDVGDLPAEHEVAQVGRSFNHMLDNVEGALLAREASEGKLRRFVADASHELRNPLAAITGYSELAERHAQGLDANTTFALGRITAESTRMRALVEQLLTLARLDAHEQAVAEPVDAVEAVLNAVSDARAASPEHRWRLRLPEEPVVVLAGAAQLQQVLVNLLGNARKHTPPGTTVEAEVTPSGIISVTDDGPGIPPEVLPRVWERFTRADDARRHTVEGSTGLGLAIVKAQVESFGGQVRVESRPGRTQFAVRLPLAE